MENIDWNKFGIKGESKDESFEALCEHLFCRELGASNGIRADFNQAGIETEPIKKSGFQAKYFDHSTDYKQIEKSVNLALERYKGKLKCIRIYLNTKAKPGENKKIVPRLEKKAEQCGVRIDWFTHNRFKVALLQPSNLDLAQLYFGQGDHIGFIENNIDSRKKTLLLSSQYVSIPFIAPNNSKLGDISSDIIKQSSKTILLSGHPASGKSTTLHQLFSSLAGLDKTTTRQMVNVIKKNQAVPQIINLKNCATNTLEDILRNRRSDFNLAGSKLGLIYLLDGLDELNERQADLVLNQIRELSEKPSTRKIIISCRSGNINRIKFFSYFKDAAEYKIGTLGLKDIDRFFKAKNDQRKITSLNTLKRTNPKLIAEVTDVFSLVLLWEAISQLRNESTTVDLFSIKVHKILDTPDLYKNLPSLNILNPKKEAILALNEDISFNFNYGFQPVMPLKDLQEMILAKHPRVGYSDTNDIIDYLASMFFDDPGPGSTRPSFVYQHRRYQEYFFIQKLFKVYRTDPKILRKSGVLSDNDLFEEMFMKGLRRQYKKQNDLLGCMDLNLIDVYLGNHRGFGVDDPYYLESDEFMPALLSQGEENFNRLLEDENLKLRRKIFIKPDAVRARTEKWQDDTDDYWSREYLKSTWENGIAWLVKNVARFWKAEKQEIARELINDIVEIQNIYEKSKLLDSLKKHERVGNPYWAEYESYLYYLIVIDKRDALKVFKDEIKPELKRLKNRDFAWREDGRDKALNSYLRTCIDNAPDKLPIIFDLLEDRDKINMLKILFTPERLSTLVDMQQLQQNVKKFVSTYTTDIDKSNYCVTFYKKFFNLNIKKSERDFLESFRQEEILKKQSHDWKMYDYLNQFAYISYALGVNKLEQEVRPSNEYSSGYFNDQVVYAGLFQQWVEVLRNQANASSIIRMYIQYAEINDRQMYRQETFMADISKILARIIVTSKESIVMKQSLVTRLGQEEGLISKLYFYKQLFTLDPSQFKRLIPREQIVPLEKELGKWQDDYPSKIDRYFDLCQLYSNLNRPKSVDLFQKAVVDGTLRHGWRKDTIVSYGLIEAFETLLDHNFLSRSEVNKYSQSLFDLTMHVRRITDGKGTWRGPYNLIEALTKYDLDIARKYKDLFVKEEGRYNASNIIITPIILREVELGLSVELIEKHMGEYFKSYDYEHKPNAEFYEQKFRVYLAIALSDLYFEAERKESIEKAHGLIEELKEGKVSYFLTDHSFREEKQQYLELCRKYKKTPNIATESNNNEFKDTTNRRVDEAKLRTEIVNAKTHQKINGIYRRLRTIKIEEPETWKVLIEKTYSVTGHIQPFIKIMKKDSFPHTDFYSHNSPYLHLGLAYALENTSTRQSVLNYLYDNTGHGGFANVIKSYAQIDDEKMCRKLFGRYLALCKLLVE